MFAEPVRYASIMLAAGIGIPVLAALNAQLGQRLGAPVAAAAILFSVAFGIAAVVLVLTGSAPALRALPGTPKHLFLAGALVAFYVLSITWVAPRFGVGNAIFCVLMGQMLSAALIDHFGLFGALERPLSVQRLAGLVLMALSLVLIQRS
ncbi:MAG TPA: DMT family transporter [Paracoccaceae bacterium]|nr:DMT family transporter [Paracoccaceae bacterium]